MRSMYLKHHKGFRKASLLNDQYANVNLIQIAYTFCVNANASFPASRQHSGT